MVSVSRSHPSIHRATRGTQGEREMYRTTLIDLFSVSLATMMTNCMRTLHHFSAVIFFSFAVSACVAPHTLQPFSTDGCSFFPDRNLIGKTDWCNCCLTHDLAYWQGGTSEARLDADQQLKACVLRASGNKELADLIYAGVRLGGGPYFYTPYRWGYGWSYGRRYALLTPAELESVSKFEREYRASNPALSCPK